MPDYDDSEYLADPEEDERQPTLPMSDDEPEPEPEPERPKRQRKATAPEKAAAKVPLGQVETDETLHGEVRITRSLSLGSKNDQIHLSVMLPVVVQPGWSLPQQAVAAADTCGIVKSLVYSQLGLEFTIDEEGIMHEVLRSFPGAEKVRDPEPRSRREELREDDDRRADERQSRRDEYRENGGSGRFAHPADLKRPEHVDSEVWDDLVHNFDDWYDNRRDKDSGKYKNTAPDFKRAEDGEAVWLKPFRRESNRPTSRRH